MRILTTLRARANTTYDVSYHNKLRGRMWRALRGTDYEQYHDEPRPLGLSFSNVFPWGDIDEGESYHLLIASCDEELLAHIADDFVTSPELNIGEMPFTIEDVNPVYPDVGEPGTTGTIMTDTGVCVRLSPEECDDYGIDTRFDETDTFWRPEHSMEPFVDAIHQNTQWKHGIFGDDYVPGPQDAGYGELFSGYEFIKDFSIPVTVTKGETHPHVLSKWRFDYEVQNDTHRKHLNLLLNTGIGERNGFGFGFCNIIDGGNREGS